MIESSRWVGLFAVTAGLCSFFFPLWNSSLKICLMSHIYMPLFAVLITFKSKNF